MSGAVLGSVCWSGLQLCLLSFEKQLWLRALRSVSSDLRSDLSSNTLNHQRGFHAASRPGVWTSADGNSDCSNRIRKNEVKTETDSRSDEFTHTHTHTLRILKVSIDQISCPSCPNQDVKWLPVALQQALWATPTTDSDPSMKLHRIPKRCSRHPWNP